jgi:hypothetical protein
MITRAWNDIKEDVVIINKASPTASSYDIPVVKNVHEE